MKTGAFILWKSYTRFCLPVMLVTGLLSNLAVRSQCPSGYNRATLDWDNLDFFTYTGNYSSGYLPNSSWAYTQNFAFGANNRLTIDVDANFVLLGEVTSHSGDAGSYGSGSDVGFDPEDGLTHPITFTFDAEVRNVKFSLYDLDNGAVVNITAVNAANVAQTVTLSKANPGSGITFTNNPGTNPRSTSPSGGINSNDARGTLNVDIAGPVKKITISHAGTGSDLFLSAISACTAGSFPNNYYQISKPFNGQPAYMLIALDETVYMLDPVTGKAKAIFTDGLGLGNINSMAYDPYNRILYYVYSLSLNPATNKVLKKYDFNTESISTVLNDITTIGIPVTSNGVESGAAAFYNGSLYLGIETSNSSRNSGRENVIWRIDFNGSNVPYRSSQVWAMPVDNGGTLIKDWADFTINDGILYDFDGAGTTSQTDVYHVDMMTGAVVNYNKPSGWTPGQPTLDYNGNIYNIYSTTSTAPYIARYNENGTIGTRVTVTSTPAIPNSASLGDAAEAFRPRSDFGDAPASYDPNPLSPATHEFLSTLRIGNTYDYEWNISSSSAATGDGADEDGIGAAPSLDVGGTITYSVPNIRVFNNTGGTAVLAGWLDYNFNGVFEPGEGVTVNVPSSPSAQFVTLNWNNIAVGNTSLPATFLRLRITRTGNGMTVNSMTGWLPDGEVEDYQVLIGAILPKDLQQFTAAKNKNEAVALKWTINVQQPVANYEVWRSNDEVNWKKITTLAAQAGTGIQQYNYLDENPAAGTSYYRIKINYVANNSNKFSDVRSVKTSAVKEFIAIHPNPVTEAATLQFNAAQQGDAEIRLIDKSGKLIMTTHKQVVAGANEVQLSNLSIYPAGVYTLRVIMQDRKTVNTSLIIRK